MTCRLYEIYLFNSQFEKGSDLANTFVSAFTVSYNKLEIIMKN